MRVLGAAAVALFSGATVLIILTTVSVATIIPGVLAVLVIDDITGEPLANARVRVEGFLETEAITGIDGAVVFPALASGEYTITGEFGGRTFREDFVILAGDITLLTVRPSPVLFDDDGDGFGEEIETQRLGLDPDTNDTDNDGLPDDFEVVFDLGPKDPASAEIDTDGDGSNNAAEYIARTNPRDPNSVPAKGLTTGSVSIVVQDITSKARLQNVEVALQGSANYMQSTDENGAVSWNDVIEGSYTIAIAFSGYFEINQAVSIGSEAFIETIYLNPSTGSTRYFADQDVDGLEDSVEQNLTGTAPDSLDTDGDLIPDDVEIAVGTDPLTPNAFTDTNGDGTTNAVDIQKVINGALDLLGMDDTPDVNFDSMIDAQDIQTVINRALGIFA